jgi:hypothetical protein
VRENRLRHADQSRLRLEADKAGRKLRRTAHPLYITEIRPTIHLRRAKELREAASAVFEKVTDTAREAVRMAIGRKLDLEAMVEFVAPASGRRPRVSRDSSSGHSSHPGFTL